MAALGRPDALVTELRLFTSLGSSAQPEQDLEHWKEVPRAEMFERIILTVDCCRGEGEALGDEATMRRCDEQIEFLEAEIERARRGY